MAYALFAQRKVELTGHVNSISLQQTQRSNEQNLLATNTLSLKQQMSSMQSAQSIQLGDLYKLLSYSNGDDVRGLNTTGLDSSMVRDLNTTAQKYSLSSSTLTRAQINAKIKELESKFEAELADINNQIYVVSVKENAIEMEVKRLDTQLSSLQKQLEAIEEAESSGIDRSTPKFNGVG